MTPAQRLRDSARASTCTVWKRQCEEEAEALERRKFDPSAPLSSTAARLLGIGMRKVQKEGKVIQ